MNKSNISSDVVSFINFCLNKITEKRNAMMSKGKERRAYSKTCESNTIIGQPEIVTENVQRDNMVNYTDLEETSGLCDSKYISGEDHKTKYKVKRSNKTDNSDCNINIQNVETNFEIQPNKECFTEVSSTSGELNQVNECIVFKKKKRNKKRNYLEENTNITLSNSCHETEKPSDFCNIKSLSNNTADDVANEEEVYNIKKKKHLGKTDIATENDFLYQFQLFINNKKENHQLEIETEKIEEKTDTVQEEDISGVSSGINGCIEDSVFKKRRKRKHKEVDLKENSTIAENDNQVDNDINKELEVKHNKKQKLHHAEETDNKNLKEYKLKKINIISNVLVQVNNLNEFRDSDNSDMILALEENLKHKYKTDYDATGATTVNSQIERTFIEINDSSSYGMSETEVAYHGDNETSKNNNSAFDECETNSQVKRKKHKHKHHKIDYEGVIDNNQVEHSFTEINDSTSYANNESEVIYQEKSKGNKHNSSGINDVSICEATNETGSNSQIKKKKHKHKQYKVDYEAAENDNQIEHSLTNSSFYSISENEVIHQEKSKKNKHNNSDLNDISVCELTNDSQLHSQVKHKHHKAYCEGTTDDSQVEHNLTNISHSTSYANNETEVIYQEKSKKNKHNSSNLNYISICEATGDSKLNSQIKKSKDKNRHHKMDYEAEKDYNQAQHSFTEISDRSSYENEVVYQKQSKRNEHNNSNLNDISMCEVTNDSVLNSLLKKNKRKHKHHKIDYEVSKDNNQVEHNFTEINDSSSFANNETEVVYQELSKRSKYNSSNLSNIGICEAANENESNSQIKRKKHKHHKTDSEVTTDYSQKEHNFAEISDSSFYAFSENEVVCQEKNKHNSSDLNDTSICKITSESESNSQIKKKKHKHKHHKTDSETSTGDNQVEHSFTNINGSSSFANSKDKVVDKEKKKKNKHNSSGSCLKTNSVMESDIFETSTPVKHKKKKTTHESFSSECSSYDDRGKKMKVSAINNNFEITTDEVIPETNYSNLEIRLKDKNKKSKRSKHEDSTVESTQNQSGETSEIMRIKAEDSKDYTQRDSFFDNDNSSLSRYDLSDLHIVVDWELPLLHTVETNLNTMSSQKMAELMSRMNVDIKKGVFSEKENNSIMKNFEEFCNEYKLPNDPEPFLRFYKVGKKGLAQTERIRFVQYLAKDLPNRLLSTVYRRFKLMAKPYKNTGRRFSAEEDKLIVKMIQKGGYRFVDMAEMLSRHPHSILKRYEALTCGKNRSAWNFTVAELLLKAIMEVTLVVKIDELKDRQIHEEEWKKIAKIVGMYATRLKDTWYLKLHPKLFIPDHMTIETVVREVTSRLLESHVKKWSDINWDDLAKPFEGWNGLYLKRIIYYCFKNIPDKNPKNLKACYRFVLENLSNFHFYKRRRLVYNNGRLIEVTLKS